MAIKQNINLNKLKKSGIEKHKKIHAKAVRIMAEGYCTPLLSHMELEVVSDKYRENGLRVNVTISGDISISSKCDEWIVVDEGCYYVLYHGTTIGMRGKNKHDYHIQDIFYDLDFLFASVVTHDDYKMNTAHASMGDVRSVINNASVLDYGRIVEVQEFMC